MELSGVPALSAAIGTRIRRPLWQHNAVSCALLVCAGLFCFVVCHTNAGRRERLALDPARRQRRELSNSLQRFRRDVGSGRGEIDRAAYRARLITLTTSALTLPDGATGTALARQVEDELPEFAALLHAVEREEFRPNAAGTGIVDMEAIKQTVTRLGAWLVVAGSILFAGAPPAAANKGNGAADAMQTAAKNAFAAGQFDRASVLYAALTQPGLEDPGLLYNRASCAAHAGRDAEALAFCERARRAAPRDPDIASMRVILRRRLNLPTPRPAMTTLQVLRSLRDRFRPDEWFLAAAVCVFCWGLGAGLLRLRQRSIVPVSLGAILLAAAALGAAWSQSRTVYRPDSQLTVINPHTVAYSFPSVHSRPLNQRPQPGADALVRETRQEWYRVDTGRAQGWIRKQDAIMLW